MCKRILPSSTLILVQFARDGISNLGQFLFLFLEILFLGRRGVLVEPINCILACVEELLLVFGVEFTAKLFLIGDLVLERVRVVLQTCAS